MNIVDSSCWLDYLAGIPDGDFAAAAIEDTRSLCVPTIILYEVFKKLLIETDEDKALLAAAHMKQGSVVELDADLSILAAKIGRDHKLPMADSIIYAATRKYGCFLWTRDRHFRGLEGVEYSEKV